jgi:hypothetical protein
MNKPYEHRVDTDQKNYVHGPGNGLDYFSGILWPELRCNSQEEAERAATIANIAYEQGYKAAQLEARKALGLKG